MLLVALVLNIVILAPIVVGLTIGGRVIFRVMGTLTPARSSLLAMYLAFLATSILFLFWPLEPGIITLLAIQIAYQVLSAFTVRVLTNPIVITNLLLAAIQTGLLVLHTMPL